MSQQITSRTLPGPIVDQRLVLAAGQASRLLAFLTTWTHVRIGIQYSHNNVASIIGGPVMAFGLTAGTANGFGDASTTHFLGLVTNNDFTFNAGPTQYNAQSTWIVKKKVLAVVTGGTSTAAMFGSADPTLKRTALILDITKGSPNFSIGVGLCGSAAAAQTDCTDALFLQMMELTTLSTISSVITGYALSGGGPSTIAIDESTNGFFNAVNLYWDRTAAGCEISSVRIKKFA